MLQFSKEETDKIIEGLYSPTNEHHGKAHILEVLKGLEVARVDFELTDNEYRLLYIAVVYHDCDMSDRKTHHLLSAEKFLADKPNFLTEGLIEPEMLCIAQIIKQHRSSIPFKDKGRLGRIITKIDTGYPFNVFAMLDRVIKYHYEKDNRVNPNTLLTNAMAHIHNKYGKGGYAVAEFSDKEISVLHEHIYDERFEIYASNRIRDVMRRN